MMTIMPDFKHSKFLPVIPAVFVMLFIYSIGINSHLSFKEDYNVAEVDANGPATQLKHISSGFYHSYFEFSTFYSMMASVIYVPYIWVRTSMLPPYDIDALDKRSPSLKSELTIILRCMNIMAALGILLISFYLMRIFCKTLLPPFLVSLMVALNPNLMVQSNATYFESWCIFFVMLSALFFIKMIFGKTKTFFWFAGFMVIAALAVSVHERMAGYYFLSGPFIIYKFFKVRRMGKESMGRTLFLTVIGLGFGFLVYCFVNGVFFFGFGPIFQYFYDRGHILDLGPDRFRGPLEFIDKQFRCQRHAIWMTICNLGFITPLFSVCGLWSIWKKRFLPPITLLLFPIGYQILSIGMPGSAMGRYVMGQTIFVTLYAGLGIAWCMDYAKKTNRMAAFWIVIIAALLAQLFLVVSIKVATIYYNPYRIAEKLIRDPANKGKKIIVRGVVMPVIFSTDNNVTCEVIKGIGCPPMLETGATITILNSRTGSGHGNLLKKEVRNPPRWLVFMPGIRMCYLLVHYCPVTIEWRDED